jgi:CheY-like chemotaxis protein
MSGLQDFLAPFSHLLFANRDKAIVVLGIVLGWCTIQLLIARWRNERLQRDLAAAKSAPSGSSSRRYAPSAQVEEPPSAESGALPPVKGGRTYARNLGTALSKAGISSSQQIYSPPAPQGWGPNSNAGQPGMGQPTQGAPYAPPNTPWGAPAPQQQQAPWGFPGGPGRPMPPQSPSQAPFYQPQPPMPQQQPGAMPPMNTPPSAPGFFGPPGAPAFAHPAFAPATSGTTAPAPPTAQPAPPVGPPMPPAYNNPPAGPAPEPAAPDAGRRGKPKRRRFNFNVLENLEKIVQARSEPLPPTGWQPPAGASPTPVPPATMVPPVGAPPELRVVPQPAPAAEAVSTVKEPQAEAPSLPLPFGQDVQDVPKTTEQESAATETEEPTVAEEDEARAVGSEMETSSDVSDAEAETPVAEVEVEQATPPATSPTPEPRKSMREMLFGEEAPAAAEAEPTATPSQSEPEPASADWSWRPTRWEPTESTASTPEKETASSEPAAEEPVAEDGPAVEDASEASPIAEASEPEPFAPWKSSFASEAAVESEPAKVDGDEAPAGSFTGPPAGDADNGPSAGTIVIIEDDETAASYYATLFRGNGYRVEVANDGVSGVDLCTRVQPQVILLDVMMPRQNGILVLQTLRASDETKNTPVVVMSNFSEPTLIKRAIQLGALEYVIKTQVEGTALLSAMPRWMNREKAFAAA